MSPNELSPDFHPEGSMDNCFRMLVAPDWVSDENDREKARGNPFPRRQRRLRQRACLPSELGLEGCQ